MQSLIVVGFDGFAKSVIDSAIGSNDFDPIIILDDDKIGQTFANARVVDSTDKLKDYYDQGYRMIYIANENDLEWRQEFVNRAKEIGFSFCKIVDPSANIAPDVTIGAGTYVGKGCVVGPCATIGENSILDTGTIMQSGSCVGNLSRICTGGVISYDAKIGDMCYVGVRSIVTEKTQVPDNTEVADISVYGKQSFEQ